MYNGIFQRNTGGTAWRKWLLIGSSILGALVLICCLVFLNSSEKPEPTEPVTVAAIQVDQTQSSTTATTATKPPATQATQPTTEQPKKPEEASTPNLPQTQEEHILTCSNYFVYDVTAGEYLTQTGDGSTRLYPASITKLFTIYVAQQYMDPDAVVTVGPEITMIDPDSTTADLRQGDVLTVTQLMQGMMLPSGNDAAYALAAAAGRVIAQDNTLSAWSAVQVFVEEMNRQAQTLGLTGSHFSNPDGIHTYDHYFSMDDMVTLGKISLDNPQLVQIASTATVTITLGERTVTWRNTNALVHPSHDYYCPDAVGLKTGRTTAAGYCVLEAIAMEDRVLLVGIFGAADKDARFADAIYVINQTLQTEQ